MTDWFDAPPGPWRSLAACRTVPTAAFFPEGAGPVVVPPEAVAACARCKVRYECLAEVLEWTDEADHGYRASTTAGERRKMRARRRRGAA